MLFLTAQSETACHPHSRPDAHYCITSLVSIRHLLPSSCLFGPSLCPPPGMSAPGKPDLSSCLVLLARPSDQCQVHTRPPVCACWLNNLSSSLPVLDTNDRFLRKITIGQANTEKGFSRQVGGFFFLGVALFLPVSVCTGPEAGSLLFSFSLQPPLGLPPYQSFVYSLSVGPGEDQKLGSPWCYVIILSSRDFSRVSAMSPSGCPLNVNPNTFHCNPTQLLLRLHYN